ncbi:MAG: sigma-70 family RNA polymerase sigma factor [Eubacterium sp.]|nr:sigma-70 family RNA polymerase sigma factor [Eubacterium sp.]
MLKRIKQIIIRLFRKQKCFYINGPEALPPPLSKEREQEITQEIRNGDFSNRDLLITHNLRLVVYIAKKFESKTTSTEDLVSIGTIGLMKAVKTFNPDKNIKLATYASRCIENEILMHLRKVNNMKSEISFDEPLSIDWDGNELTLRDVLGTEPDDVYDELEYDDEKRLLVSVVETLSPKEQELMVKRFGLYGEEPRTQKQLADLMGISQSYISRLEKRILEKLKQRLISMQT